jgi:hypothetical protein
MKEVKHTKLTVRYDGKMFDDHSMNAIELANAIKGMAESLIHANKVLNGENSELEVKVVAFQDGCFGTVLDILQTNLDSIDVLKVMGFTGSTAVVEGVRQGIIQHLENIKGRMVKTKSTQRAITKITLDDGTIFETEPKVAKLLTDNAFRKSIEDVFYSPLVHEDATSVTIGQPKDGGNAAEIEPLIQVRSDEKVSFKLPSNLVVKEETTEIVMKEVYFTKINFTQSTGWKAKFADGKEKSVTMSDEKFMARVRLAEENFTSNMLFVVKFEYTKTKSIKGSSEKYVVKHVSRHRANSGDKII